jgi:hypothetical protein
LLRCKRCDEANLQSRLRLSAAVSVGLNPIANEVA